ncbi:HET-domain-containing protein [Rhizodiscina lignyota]|uniref:HET-domain-containing protein n=1 Tax=Rhizodiscina lignyota TaxID=1504668 RepID=A0A9P4IT42_9PEZI|nr:HET-domain-containing protein [Rhizodiscina lignyota]
MHQCYPQNLRFVPTRLLDVGDEDQAVIRLSSESNGQTTPIKYMALSHQWGPPGQHRKFCTYKSNIEELKKNISIAALPRTFQDAVHITRSLGVRYLWVDSLCIIQNDPCDWERESKFMEQVFSSAYCTLAASCARGVDDSFLKAPPARHGVTLVNPHSSSLYYLYESIDDFHNHVDQGELNMRGWVLQERALSRRTIYFTETQSYWECGGGVRCETLTKSKNRKASFLGDSNFPHSVDAYVKGMKIELYQDLYERYSKLALSFSADRPVAIRGLESRLSQTFRTAGGYGVFELYLHRCLLWQRTGDRVKRIGEFHGMRVPSWSWMAYDGGIRYMDVPYGGVSWREDIVSPFAKAKKLDRSNETVMEGSEGTIGLEIEAPAYDLLEPHSEKILLDEPGRKLPRFLKCVIVGEDKSPTRGDSRVCYVLIIVFFAFVDGVEVWERVGVGALVRRHIILDGVQTKVHIQ